MNDFLRNAVCAATGLALAACTNGNNPLLGRVENEVARHRVVVLGCVTSNPPEPRSTDDGGSWAPCKDASVAIQGTALFVNGEGYGELHDGDSVLVDHGKVTVKPQ
jgi:hypothetical protein